MTKPNEATSAAEFKHHRIATCGISVHVVEIGVGPLMVMVSGWPQTWYSWHKIMLDLARHFRVVAVDLPGLGDSDFPKDGYDTGSISLHLDAFGADDCTLVTHDIGAWVGYAYAARRPECVKRLALIDAAIPGLSPPEAFRFSSETARKVWHFYFNYIPDLPELLVVGREREFLTWSFRTKSVDWATAFDTEAVDIYVNAYSAPGRWSGGLGYYRSVFDSIEQNRMTASSPLTIPLLAIGGASSLGEAMAKSAVQIAEHVQGAVIESCGHYVPDERPDELLAVLLPFSLA
jgi:pimeloyl-ACP methyl ester carboxylesterase